MTSVPWYHKTTIYQIYPRSFYDSNGDGMGDLNGIIQKLDYIHHLGFETIWTSPFFASPQADLGYDISDYTSIAPEYGTMDDVSYLIEEVHRRGMRIVFDLVMNHTSVEHAWFKESRSSRHNPKADWYIWKDPSPSPFRRRSRGEVPNNWQSMTGGSGWHYAAERGQYFWSTFLPFQPDLNYHNPEVKRAMLDMVRFWLERGVDGFRLDIFNYIYKDQQFRNNPFSFKLLPADESSAAFFQQSKYTTNQPETFKFAREFRSVCDEFGERLSIGEVYGDRKIIREFLGIERNDGLTLVFDFGMLNFQFTSDHFRNLIQRMEQAYPPPFMPVYVFSYHDRRRSIHRLAGDTRKAKLLHMFQLTVRGVPCMYYGEEIGMTNVRLPFANAYDPIPHKFKSLPRLIFDALDITINRDEVRTPMQWDSTKNAGFSSAEKTWLPVHENYHVINVETEARDEFSLLNRVRTLLAVRQSESALQEGSLRVIENLPENILGFARKMDGVKISVLLNFDGRQKNFQSSKGDLIFALTPGSQKIDGMITLDGYGGLILKHAD